MLQIHSTDRISKEHFRKPRRVGVSPERGRQPLLAKENLGRGKVGNKYGCGYITGKEMDEMAETMTVSSSQGHTAEWHDQRLTTPVNADVELSSRNEFWIGDMNSTDADKFNEIFQDSVDDFNAKQTRPSRKMGAESTSQERQKSYYDGVVDGTFCYGKGKQKETPIQEVVLQIGNKDDNGVTDKDFDMEHWKTLKKSGHEKEASEYAISHLNKSENTERTKRILHKAVERIATLDPEHLIVIRATYHGDEPCGTGHGHLAYVLRATGYEKGMESRVASVKALEQMGFKKTKESEYGIVQLHEKFKEIIEEEMINDAIVYGYEAIQRTPDSGEHRKRSDVSEFREMAAERQDLKELQMEVNDAVADNQLREFALEQRENSVKRQKALNDEKSKEINDRDEQVRKKEMAFSEKNSELILRESNVLIKESEIDEREEKLKKKQEQDEKDFQMKEDKMEAQQRVISQREKSVSERENSVDVKENEVAQKSAEYGKKLVLLDSLIDDVQSYKSPVSVAKNVLEILKESMNEKGKRVTSDMIGVLTRNTDMLNRKYQAKINETRVKREQIQKGTYFDMSDEQDERGDRSL